MTGSRPADDRRRYSAIKTRIYIVDMLLSVFFIGAFQFWVARPFSGIVRNFPGGFYVSCAVYGTLFMAVMYLFLLPLKFYSSYIVEHDFGLSRMTIRDWFVDQTKGVVLSYLLSVFCMLGFYLILRNFPRHWWWITGSIWLVFTVVLARLLPTLLIPVFYKYSPLEDESLEEDILTMCDSAGVHVNEVSRIDMSAKTSKANAALAGWGKTRRIILGDTLTEGFSRDEILSVVAHELGHQKYAHIWQLIVFSGVSTMAGFYLLRLAGPYISSFWGVDNISDLFVLPSLIFLASVFAILSAPVHNLFSRKLEREADVFAIETTGSPQAFISVMKRLGEMNMAEDDPGLIKKIFMYDHPSISERIRMGKRYLKTDDNQ